MKCLILDAEESGKEVNMLLGEILTELFELKEHEELEASINHIAKLLTEFKRGLETGFNLDIMKPLEMDFCKECGFPIGCIDKRCPVIGCESVERNKNG